MKEHFEPTLKISLGISRRDFFAAFALAGIVANPNNESLSNEVCVLGALNIADIMIEESEKGW